MGCDPIWPANGWGWWLTGGDPQGQNMGQVPVQGIFHQNNLFDKEIWSIHKDDVEKIRRLSRKLADWLKLTDQDQRKGENVFMYVMRLLDQADTIMTIESRPKKREPLAQEKPKFDNRPAGMRWR